MNIFVLDLDHHKCAEYHNNKHVVKQTLEMAQMLCSSIRFAGVDWGYKKTHINHPCNVWMRKTQTNFLWAQKLGIELCREYSFRYERVHKSQAIIEEAINFSYLFPEGDLTPFAQAMPEQYKNPDAVTAYRNYYIGEKLKFTQYKKREVPEWIKLAVSKENTQE